MSEYDPFAADYDVWAEQMSADVAWYVELAREAREPIVELAVGTGRVAVPIARETGKRIIGIDVSSEMLALARERAGDLPVDFRQGDMRELSLDEPVGLVICPARSLLHLPTWSDRLRVFEHVATSLVPGGRFAWNAFVFKPQIGLDLDGHRREGPDGRWEELHYDFADTRVDLTRGRGAETYGTVSLWWIAKTEWEGLVTAAGLEVEALYGGFEREPFGPDADEFVYVARKPAA
jgi:ubiquinone/menaquinone biosynthesis C-methylase UbiE